MKTIQINVPDSVDMKDFDLLMFMASKLYEEARLTLGEAAEMAGVSKRTFIEILAKYNVSLFGDSVEDLKADIENAKSLYN